MESKDPDSRPSLESSGSRSPVREPQGNKFRDLAPGQDTGASPQDGATPAPGKKKILRAIALSVGSLFLIALVVFGWWAYRQWTDMKEIVESARRISSALEAGMGALARPPAGQFSKSSASLHLAIQTSRPGKSKLQVVPFSLGSGGLPRGITEIMRNPQKIFKSLSKYKDRPLVREFINDLNSDPEFKKAWEKRSTGNPIKLFSQIHNMKNLTGIIEKYAERPEFAILMIEVMNDPELKPFFEIIDPGVTGDLQTMTLDPSQIQGNKSTSTFGVRPFVVPPP